jgi:hypothetical protein
MARRGDGWQAFMAQHPSAASSATEEFWVDYLGEHPDVLHRLLADVYEATFGADAPPTLDDLWQLMSAQPRYASAPFGQAVVEALGDRSINWLAQQTGVSQPTLSRMVNGIKPVVNIKDVSGSMYRLERIASVLRVHPSYFAEWRRMWIMTLLDSAFTAQPTLSIGVFRRYSGFDRRERTLA